MLSVGLKTHTNRFRPGLRPGSYWIIFTASPDLLVCGQGAGYPLVPRISFLWASLLLASSILTTFRRPYIHLLYFKFPVLLTTNYCAVPTKTSTASSPLTSSSTKPVDVTGFLSACSSSSPPGLSSFQSAGRSRLASWILVRFRMILGSVFGRSRPVHLLHHPDCPSSSRLDVPTGWTFQAGVVDPHPVPGDPGVGVRPFSACSSRRARSTSAGSRSTTSTARSSSARGRMTATRLT